MAVEFLGAGYGNPSTETDAARRTRLGPRLHPRDRARPRGSTAGTTCCSPTPPTDRTRPRPPPGPPRTPDRIQLRVAHRPERLGAHVRGQDLRDPRHRVRRPGHRAPHRRRADQRPARRGRRPGQGRALRPARATTRDVLLRSWTSDEPFSHAGAVLPRRRTSCSVPGPAGVPGSRLAGRRDGRSRSDAAVADVFAFFGEPLAATAEQVTLLRALAAAAGRPDAPAADRLPADRGAPRTRRRGPRRTRSAPASTSWPAPRPVATLTEAPRAPGALPENTANLRLAPARGSGSGTTARCGRRP